MSVTNITKVKDEIEKLKYHLLNEIKNIDDLRNNLEDGQMEVYIHLMNLKKMLLQTRTSAEQAGWAVNKWIYKELS